MTTLRVYGLAFTLLLAACPGGKAPEGETPPAGEGTEATPPSGEAATTPETAETPSGEVASPGKATPSGTVEVTLPTGKVVTAEKFTDPAAGTVEESIVTSIRMIGAGEFEPWMDGWCHASYCGTPEQRLSLSTYNLPATKGTAAQCVQDDGRTITVTRRDPPEADGSVRVYVYCGDSRMPAPSSHVLDGERWKVISFSW